MRQIWTETKPEFFDSSNKIRLPVKEARNILITSALPYVNNVPHLGNIIGSVLSADVFSRYCQMQGYQSLYICGTDEYGTATEMKAIKDGVSVQEICDKFHVLHKQIYDWFNIDFDYFGRTTTQHQTEICQDIFNKVHKNNFTSTSFLEQLHCEKCDRFLADRYVSGICPHCKFSDARGDQCDGCGKLLDAVELVEPKCHLCQNTPKVKQSKHIFLDLDKLAGEVEKHFDAVTSAKDSHWSANAVSIVKSWLKKGLEKRCITRDLKWGTPVPLEEFASKVFYVWFDAPIGYLSMTKALLGDEGMEKWWKNPDEVELYQFLGKDNVAFHGVVFPATQIATGENYTKIRHMCATEYLNYEDKKFSKSRNTGVFGDSVSTIGVQADIWRFYLVYMRPESKDTAFSWDDFISKVNTELNDNLGNFVQRSLTFVFNHFQGVIPAMKLTAIEEELFSAVNNELEEFTKNLESVKLRNALVGILSISRLGNQYIQANKPWLTVKGTDEEKQRAATVVAVAANLSMLLSTILYPFMPEVSKQIREKCNIRQSIRLPNAFIQFLVEGHTISKPVPLFPKLDDASIKEWKVRFGATSQGDEKPVKSTQTTDKKLNDTANSGGKAMPVSDKEVDVGRLDLRVGRILEVKKHPDADSLYVETIDLGEASPRTVVSGLVKHVPLEQMQDRMVLCLCNLKPAKRRGVPGHGDVCFLSAQGGIMEVDPSCIPGDIVEYGNFTRRPDAVLNPRKRSGRRWPWI
uniref:Methionine--tRNA ligase, cytoplasmic n=1 Tax=Ditylenchus dipsaci TaxID=166011 RepID=A0A915DF15_9BILA